MSLNVHEYCALKKIAAGEAIEYIPETLISKRLVKPVAVAPPLFKGGYGVVIADFALTEKGKRILTPR